RAVHGPSVSAHCADEIEIHQQIHVLVAAWKSDLQPGGTRFDPEMHGTKGIAERSVQKRLLAVTIVFGAGGRNFARTARGREPTMREQATVGCEQPAAGRRVMTRGTPLVLFRKEHRLGARRRGDADRSQQKRSGSFHWPLTV